MKKYLYAAMFACFIAPANGQISFHSFLDSIGRISDSATKIVLIDTFFNHLNTAGIPFIEGDTANFIYYGPADTVEIAGDFNGWGRGGVWKCKRVDKTNFFYYSKTFEPTARLDYKFIINKSSWILDPRNPNRVSGGFGPNSELAMTGYIQPWEIEEYEGVPRGTIESFTLPSPQVGKSFYIQVYMPPGYAESGNYTYSTVYVHDGHEYIGLGSMGNVLDNLLDSGKIDPLLAVFIKPINREDEYAAANRFNFAQYVAETVVPYIDAHYKTYPHKENRLTMGASFGGNISGLISYTYPEVFGNSGWHSPALLPNNGEVALLYVAEKKDVKLYFNVGTYENLGVDWDSFTAELDAKGYDYEWKKFHEGHSWGFWRATIDDILTYFFPPGSTPVKTENRILAPGLECQNFPNPATTQTSIPVTLEDPGMVTLEIYNQLGQMVQYSNYTFSTPGENKIDVDISQFSMGLYFYKLQNDLKEYSGKILVQHSN